MDITAVVCTFNQAGYLEKCLSGLASQTLSGDLYEIIVVDNASKDNTETLVRNFAGIQNLRYIYEPNLGLSHARNTGWKNAEGDYVAFIDSDAVACPNWLELITEKFASFQPKPAVIGGKIMPIWEAKRPEWLSQDLETYLGIIDWSDHPFLIENDDSCYLAGSNMAFRRDALRLVNGFSAGLGRRGRRLLSNEEILLQKKLAHLSLSICYDPDICVYHHIKTSCVRKSWFYKRLYWQGISDIIVDQHVTSMKGKTWLGTSRLREDLSQLVSSFNLYAKKSLIMTTGRMAARARILYWLGRLLYGLRIQSGLTGKQEHE
jgi:glycosyltransferase involved in cell wall biosynthesis